MHFPFRILLIIIIINHINSKEIPHFHIVIHNDMHVIITDLHNFPAKM